MLCSCGEHKLARVVVFHLRICDAGAGQLGPGVLFAQVLRGQETCVSVVVNTKESFAECVCVFNEHHDFLLLFFLSKGGSPNAARTMGNLDRYIFHMTNQPRATVVATMRVASSRLRRSSSTGCQSVFQLVMAVVVLAVVQCHSLPCPSSLCAFGWRSAVCGWCVVSAQ